MIHNPLSSLFVVLLLSHSVVGQVDRVWRGILPLSSTRLEVESMTTGLAINESGQTVAPEGIISMRYAVEPCVGTGWDVPKDTVLEYTIYPKTEVYYTDFKSRLRGLTAVVDDIGSSYYTDDARGVQFAFDPSRRLSSVRHFPESRAKLRRCEGFPPFSALTYVYRPNDTFQVRDSETDVISAANFFTTLKKRTDQHGYIFIYFRQEDSEAKKKRVLQRFADILGRIPSNVTRRMKVQMGGFRDTSECEIFVLNGIYPPPLPTPKYSSRKEVRINEKPRVKK